MDTHSLPKSFNDTVSGCVKTYVPPVVTDHPVHPAYPLLDFGVETSKVDEVEEGEVGTHRRNDYPTDYSDKWGSLW